MANINTNEEALQACRLAINELISLQESCISVSRKVIQAADSGGWDDHKAEQLRQIIAEAERVYKNQIEALRDCESGLRKLIELVQTYNNG